MSYTIMYGKQFIKTSRGIIPLALHGDNNVTEYVRGREVRERHWSVYSNDKIEFTPDEYFAYLRSFCGNEYQEHFFANGKFVNDKRAYSPGRRTASARRSPSKRYAKSFPFSP